MKASNMVYKSKLLRKNEHVIKGYHLCLDRQNAVFLCQNGSLPLNNGTGGQKGGIFLWNTPNAAVNWLSKLLYCEKQALENGFKYTPVPEQVFVIEYQIPKKNFTYPIWQPDFGLNGSPFIPLILKHYYKLYKKELITQKEANFYLNCSFSNDRKRKKQIKGLVILNKNFYLEIENAGNIPFSNLNKNSVSYSGTIQRLHDFLYLKSNNYKKEYLKLVKKLVTHNQIFAIKYCGKEPLKPVAVEILDSQLRAPIARMENIAVFVQEYKNTLNLKTSSLNTSYERE